MWKPWKSQNAAFPAFPHRLENSSGVSHIPTGTAAGHYLIGANFLS
jgi:hypothetical protein